MESFGKILKKKKEMPVHLPNIGVNRLMGIYPYRETPTFSRIDTLSVLGDVSTEDERLAASQSAVHTNTSLLYITSQYCPLAGLPPAVTEGTKKPAANGATGLFFHRMESTRRRMTVLQKEVLTPQIALQR